MDPKAESTYAPPSGELISPFLTAVPLTISNSVPEVPYVQEQDLGKEAA